MGYCDIPLTYLDVTKENTPDDTLITSAGLCQIQSTVTFLVQQKPDGVVDLCLVAIFSYRHTFSLQSCPSELIQKSEPHLNWP